MASQSHTKTFSFPVMVFIGVLIILLGIVLVITFEFHAETETADATDEIPLAERAANVLENADPQAGSQLVVTYGCTACHREGAANGIAPAFVGISERAQSRIPDYSAAEYLYESIVHPGAFLVEGFNNVMVQNYGNRMSDADLGSIIAYLLTADAQ
jgi:cytochrome c2